MASFKLNIADPKTGRCYKTEVKDQQAAPFIGLNVGEKIEGNRLGIHDYEFLITGGTDYCGFPMRKGILGVRKKITMYKGVGFKGALKGIKKRKTVCGHKINESIAAINLKVLKEGTKKLSDMFGKKEEGKVEEPKKEVREEKPKEKEPKKQVKGEKAEVKKEEKQEKTEKKEAKPEGKPKEQTKETQQ